MLEKNWMILLEIKILPIKNNKKIIKKPKNKLQNYLQW